MTLRALLLLLLAAPAFAQDPPPPIQMPGYIELGVLADPIDVVHDIVIQQAGEDPINLESSNVRKRVVRARAMTVNVDAPPGSVLEACVRMRRQQGEAPLHEGYIVTGCTETVPVVVQLSEPGATVGALALGAAVAIMARIRR